MTEEDRKSINRSIGLDRYIEKKESCKDYELHTTSFIFADGYSEGCSDGAKWGMETICKKILEEYKRLGEPVGFIKGLIEDLGVDL